MFLRYPELSLFFDKEHKMVDLAGYMKAVYPELREETFSERLRKLIQSYSLKSVPGESEFYLDFRYATNG